VDDVGLSGRQMQQCHFIYLERAGYSEGMQWLAGLLLLVGILAQSGGFFLHLGVGQQGRHSAGTLMTRTGALR
jgi:hypothetical protein